MKMDILFINIGEMEVYNNQSIYFDTSIYFDNNNVITPCHKHNNNTPGLVGNYSNYLGALCSQDIRSSVGWCFNPHLHINIIVEIELSH